MNIKIGEIFVTENGIELQIQLPNGNDEDIKKELEEVSGKLEDIIYKAIVKENKSDK